jgi:hypothetical protein
MAIDLYPLALLECLRKHELVMFVGAGLSIPCGGRSWPDLSRQFLTELNLDLGHKALVEEARKALTAVGKGSVATAIETLALSTLDPLMLAQLYQETSGRSRIIQVLRDMCERMTLPSRAHDIIATLDIPMFVTTNYDDLLEQALKNRKKHPQVLVREEDAAYWSSAAVRVIKMHGSLVNPFDAESVVIAREDYEAYSDRRPNMDLLIRFLMTTSTILMLGYSVRDPNFLALHDRVRLTLKKHKNKIFFVTFDMVPDIRRYWEGYGFQPIILTGPDKTAAMEAWLTELKSRI